ncbi:hypothetical protein EGW08_018357 [Elysia chlorotica]|uniref:G-protein coupled receptors family 1 profile domain-containing protein n=1 Tax=Elysia chlorotica TaxID=188477 RepID=A0A3S0ZBG9_ELYCH|nr:hypothetical protein EGW08_018357 [Elysia chlorotica]
MNMDNNNNTIASWHTIKPLLSLAAIDILSYIIYFTITAPVSLLGIFTNIANVIVYCKMGFSESSNAHFLALAVFDFFFSLIQLMMRTLYNPVFKGLHNRALLMYLSHCLSHGLYVMVGGSAMMTALIATERCVCVVFPLKVKSSYRKIFLLGIFTNIANVIVYCKMGFSESSNAHFLALAVFDFFFSLIQLMMRTLYNPVFKGLHNRALLMYLSHCLSHGLYVMVGGSAMMTALIATERCVCVVFPLKVKTLLTRRRSLYLMLTVVAYHVAFLVLIYSDPGPPYDAHPQRLAFYYFSLYVIPSTTCFFIVVFTTIFLILKLRQNQEWRRKTSTQTDKSSVKEDKLVRTIIAISTLFIICSFPDVAIFIGQIVYPRFDYNDPQFSNLLLFLFGIGLNSQGVSASVNIFFYYKMSSKFKRVFNACFALKCFGKSVVLEEKTSKK